MHGHRKPTMPAWQIREPTAEDVAAIIALFGIGDDAAAAGAPHQYRGAWAAPKSEREVLGLLEHPDIALFVAGSRAASFDKSSRGSRRCPRTRCSFHVVLRSSMTSW
jgi:hypothetical protein